MDLSRQNSGDPEARAKRQGWRVSTLWEYFGMGGSKHPPPQTAPRTEPQESADDGERVQYHESGGLSRDEPYRTASSTTIDAGQSRVLTAFNNFMHLPKETPTEAKPIERIDFGSTFERSVEGELEDGLTEKWEPADATQYRIRSKNYLRTRIKEECKGAFYEVIGSDLISFSKKQNHVAEMIHLPRDPYERTEGAAAAIVEYGIPTLLVVNMQLPAYQVWTSLPQSHQPHSPALFGACDGPGHSFVFYCVLREHFDPRTFQNQAALGLFRRFVKECRNQTQYRIKLIPKFLNVEEWAKKGPLTQTVYPPKCEKFNEKPILTRPYQHFFQGVGYFEIDVDVHSWLFVARKALWSLLPRMHEVVTEVAMLIQGNSPDDLPEHIIAVARVYRVNLMKFRYLSDFLPKEPPSNSSSHIANGMEGRRAERHAS